MREIALILGKFTQLAQILHDRWSWPSRQISTLASANSVPTSFIFSPFIWWPLKVCSFDSISIKILEDKLSRPHIIWYLDILAKKLFPSVISISNGKFTTHCTVWNLWFFGKQYLIKNLWTHNRYQILQQWGFNFRNIVKLWAFAFQDDRKMRIRYSRFTLMDVVGKSEKSSYGTERPTRVWLHK